MNERRIVFAGAGHANIAALRRLAKNPPGADMVLVNDGAKAWYTGALPALIRGDISAQDAWLDVAKLAARCGARFVDARFTGFEHDRMALEDQPGMRFDVLAISTGAVPNGGVKPVEKFLNWLTSWDGLAAPHIGIVGGGAAGVELALALRHRLGRKARIVIKAEKILGAAPMGVRRVLREELNRARIQVAEAFAERMDHIVHAYTPAPALRVRATLQLSAAQNVFAAGDCAAFPTPLPRSGAIAVRQGRILAENIRNLLAGRTLRDFKPPPATLAILSLNADEAAAWYGPLHWTGQLPMALKKRLDRRWVGVT